MATSADPVVEHDNAKLVPSEVVVFIGSKELYTMDVEGEKKYIMAFADVETAQKFAISALVLHGLEYDDEDADLDDGDYEPFCVPPEALSEAVKTVGRMTGLEKRTPIETFYATDLMSWSVPVEELKSRCLDTGESIFFLRNGSPPAVYDPKNGKWKLVRRDGKAVAS